MSIDLCKIVELPKITDARGNLTFIEGGNQIPFDIQRVYYLYDVQVAPNAVDTRTRVFISSSLPCQEVLMSYWMTVQIKNAYTSIVLLMGFMSAP